MLLLQVIQTILHRIHLKNEFQQMILHLYIKDTRRYWIPALISVIETNNPNLNYLWIQVNLSTIKLKEILNYLWKINKDQYHIIYNIIVGKVEYHVLQESNHLPKMITIKNIKKSNFLVLNKSKTNQRQPPNKLYMIWSLIKKEQMWNRNKWNK